MLTLLRSCPPVSCRILRALFEIALRRKWTLMSERLLTLCTVIERRQWEFMHPLRQFQVLTEDVCRNLEMKDVCPPIRL